MFIINENHFTGEIAIPQLAVSRIMGSLPTYGTAKAIQTVGESNLEIFVDEYTTEYLRLMFGEAYTDKLTAAWYLYATTSSKVSTLLYTITDATPRNESVEVDFDFDLTFSGLELIAGQRLESTNYARFGDTLLGTWMYGEVAIIVKTERGKVVLNVSEGEISESLELFEFHNANQPEEFERKVLNVLLPYKGAQPVSPIAYYVWYHLNQDASNNTTSMGEADLNFSRAITSEAVNAQLKLNALRNKLINAWNKMVYLNTNVATFIASNRSKFDPYVSTHSQRNMLRTINQFNI